MSLSIFPETLICNTVEKVDSYWKSFKPSNPGSPEAYQEKWKISLQFLEQVSRQNNLVVTLWDCNLNQFIYVVDRSGVLGHEVSQFLTEDGVSQSVENVHTDYRNAGFLLQKLGFSRFFGRNNLVMSWDFLYKKSDGSYFRMMQQATPVEFDTEGNPVLVLSYIYDITHLKKDNTANLIISSRSGYEMFNYNFDKNIIEEVKPFTEQEMKVLLELSAGKHTKEIASELSISPHTIDTYRRHLLTKTNCVDTTALVTYAKMTGII